jgi:hypothetical protein
MLGQYFKLGYIPVLPYPCISLILPVDAVPRSWLSLNHQYLGKVEQEPGVQVQVNQNDLQRQTAKQTVESMCSVEVMNETISKVNHEGAEI